VRQGKSSRKSLVCTARETVRLGSKSFYMASRLLGRRTRERVWLLYAWCRHCDDRCDGQMLGQSRGCTTATLEELQAATIRALAGEPSSEPAFNALACVTAQCAIPPRFGCERVSRL
jgi:15-cis-phytoene synthase